MDELVDSSGIGDDRTALRARLGEDGYLYFPRLVDPAPVRALRSSILAELAQRGWLAAGSDPEDALPDDVIRAEVVRSQEELEAALQEDGWFGGYRAIQRLEAFHRLAFDDDLVGTVRTLLGDDAFPHPRKIARVVYPSDPTLTTAPHQDYTHIQGTADFVTCWLPLGDYSRGAGGLRILRASGANGVYPVEAADGAGGIGSKVASDGPGWLTTDFHAGDVLLFHSLTVHAGSPNTSQALRLSVDYRFQSASQPITSASLKPHMHPRVPDWPDLIDGWETTRWIVPPTGMRVVEWMPPDVTAEDGLAAWHRQMPAPVSELVSIQGDGVAAPA
ncbi:MAG TPA: phytanoyl-CoA dioxygenase family protein [Nitriliruptorales bacterium]